MGGWGGVWVGGGGCVLRTLLQREDIVVFHRWLIDDLLLMVTNQTMTLGAICDILGKQRPDNSALKNTA